MVCLHPAIASIKWWRRQRFEVLGGSFMFAIRKHWWRTDSSTFFSLVLCWEAFGLIVWNLNSICIKNFTEKWCRNHSRSIANTLVTTVKNKSHTHTDRYNIFNLIYFNSIKMSKLSAMRTLYKIYDRKLLAVSKRNC